MPDSRPDPTPDLTDPAAVAALTSRRRRARNIVIAMALLAWVVIIYVAVMVKIHNEIRPG